MNRNCKYLPIAAAATIIFGLNQVYASDIATEYCKGKGGEPVPYLLKDESGEFHEIEMCCFDSGAIGTWTFRNFLIPREFWHPNILPETANPVDRFIDSAAHNSLTLDAITSFFELSARRQNPEEETE